MIKKRVLIGFIFGLLLILGLASIANASLTVSFVTPSSTGTIVTGSAFSLNVTATGMDDGVENVTNVTWYYSTDSGTSWTIFDQLNYTANDNFTYLNNTFDSTAISDSSDIDFNITVVGFNGTTTHARLNGLRLDNTAPTATCTYNGQTIINTKSPITIDPSSSTDTGDTSLSTNVTLWLPGGTQIQTNTFNVNSTSSITVIPNTPGQYVVSCFVVDELLQLGHATNITIKVGSGSDDDIITTIADTKVKKSKMPTSLAIGAMFLILSIVVIWIANGSTSRRKKRR